MSQAELTLAMMRETQQRNEHDRQRLLSLLSPKSGRASLALRRLASVLCACPKQTAGFNQLVQIVAAPKSRLSGLTSSGLQACGVGFRWTRRTCFLRSFDLTFLVPPFSTFRSLAS